MTPTLLERVDGLWAVSKPAGWVVHPAGIPDQKDLLTWARNAGAAASVAPLHRLDLETSGVVVLAEFPANHRDFLAAFDAGEVAKTYLALVIGVPRERGTINTHLDDDRRGKKLPASTEYRVLETFRERFALVEVTPRTGRKHQIRRHFHGIGFPLVGDTRYRPRKRVNVPGFPGRLWLHAADLKWSTYHFAAALPEELSNHLDFLRGSTPHDGSP